MKRLINWIRKIFGCNKPVPTPTPTPTPTVNANCEFGVKINLEK